MTHLVCATDPTYKTEDIEHEGVRFTSIPFPDGSPPTAEVNIMICPSGDFRGCALIQGSVGVSWARDGVINWHESEHVYRTATKT